MVVSVGIETLFIPHLQVGDAMDNSQIAYHLRGLADAADSDVAQHDLTTLAEALEDIAAGGMFFAPSAGPINCPHPSARYVTVEDFNGCQTEGWAMPVNDDTKRAADASVWSFSTYDDDSSIVDIRNIARPYRDAE